MILEGIWSFETSVTIREIADVRTIFAVNDYVSFHVGFKAKDLFTFVRKALVGFFVADDDLFVHGLVFWGGGNFTVFIRMGIIIVFHFKGKGDEDDFFNPLQTEYMNIDIGPYFFTRIQDQNQRSIALNLLREGGILKDPFLEQVGGWRAFGYWEMIIGKIKRSLHFRDKEFDDKACLQNTQVSNRWPVSKSPSPLSLFIMESVSEWSDCFKQGAFQPRDPSLSHWRRP